MLQENRSFDHYFARLNTFRVANGFGGPNDVDTLDALPAAPTNPADKAAPVSWSTTNATSVTLNGSDVGTSGTFNASPTAPTKLTFVATGPGGTASASTVIGVTPTPGGSGILLGASPLQVAPGGTVLLSWATSDNATVAISPLPSPEQTTPFGPNATTPVTLPTAGTFTYTAQSSSGATDSVTITVAEPAANAPTITVSQNNQGHVSQGSSATVASFKLTDQCTEDFSPDWLESHGAFNRDDPASNVFLGNGFVHIAGGFAQHANAQGDKFHFFDVRGARAMGFFDQDALPYYYFMASQFATSDRWFSALPSNSPPNRLYALAATSQGLAHALKTSLVNVKTIFELLETAGVSWKVYYTDVSPITAQPNTTLLSFQPFGPAHLQKIVPVDCTKPATPCAAGQTDYFTDLKNGTLPAVALIEPGFDVGLDEHPGNQVQPGAAYVARLINALMSSSSWTDSVFFLTFDEAGGLFDHVSPAAAVSPDGIKPALPPAGDLIPGKDDFPGFGALDFNRTGFRIPLIVVSPFTKKHFVSHTTADFTAILKLIEKRFNLANLTQRDLAQPDLTDEFFDFVNVPWRTPPTPPAQPGGPTDPGWLPCFTSRLP
jgi:phospholipase C